MLYFFIVSKTPNPMGQPTFLNNCLLETLAYILQKNVNNPTKTKPLLPHFDPLNLVLKLLIEKIN